MSAFLGPIHFIMYDKIQLQNQLLNQIILYAESIGIKDISKQLDEKCGVNETAPLESVIDQSAIHNWLNNQVVICERRLALALKLILEKDKSSLEKIGEIFYSQGEEKRLECAEVIVVDELFKVLNLTLLDGMPCDAGINVQNMDGSEVMWEVNLDTHEPYYKEISTDVDNFLFLRDKWLQGFFADNSNIEYTRLAGNIFKIMEV